MEAAGRHSAAGVVGATLWGVTAKEKLMERVEALSEEEAERLVAEFEDAKPGDIVDEWGNLSAFMRASSASMFKRLDEEEAKAGFSWEDERAS